jgi:hypothetical protein
LNDTALSALIVSAVVLGMVGSAGAIYNFQNTPDIVTPDKYDWRAVGAGTMIDWLNANFVSENEWKPHNMELLMKFENLDKKVDGLQSSVTLLQAQGDVVTQPLPTPPVTSTIDLFLTISDNKGNTKNVGYPRDVPAILIQGQSTHLEKTYLITIKSPSGNFVKDKFGQTLSDGDISEAWIPSNALAGTYTVTITLNARTDSIEFNLL